MNIEQRKKEIVYLLEKAEFPLTGSALAERFGVTRQVIVQDVALLKAEGMPILSTARGYLLQKEQKTAKRKKIIVCHSSEKIQEELQIIVDMGGRVLTTSVQHPFYGEVGEELQIKSRKDIQIFLQRIQETGCEPLLKLTKGKHCHVIEADDQKTLEEICEELQKRGILDESMIL